MEEDNRSETTLASANLETLDSSCSFELTLSNSEASSLTAENSKDVFHHSVHDNCMTWTNEEHNKYLDYLEMSFVKQLHCSMGLIAWCTGPSVGRPFEKQLSEINRSSEQFTLLQDRQDLKINFEKDADANSTDALKSPWIYCLRQESKKSTASTDLQECHKIHGQEKNLKGKRTSSYAPVSSPQQKQLHYSCCHNSEGTGQNFVDEDCEEKSRIVSWPKRLKTAGGVTSNKDQTVPCSMA